MEWGLPSFKTELSSPLSRRHDPPINIRGVDYRDGIYAWLGGRDGPTSVVFWNIRAGPGHVWLTTDNRERLVELRLSKSLIAAVSTRGYCHVWNIDTEEHKDFRLSSLTFCHFLVNGTKVALCYPGYVVHWDFDVGIVRAIQIEHDVVTLALHPTDDQFTLICLHKELIDDNYKPKEEIPPEGIHTGRNMCRMSTETFVLDNSNKFQSARSRLQNLPFNYGSVLNDSRSQEMFPGQSTLPIINHAESPPSKPSPTHFLTLGSEGEVMIHSISLAYPAATNVICLEKGLLYTCGGTEQSLVILKTREVTSSCALMQPDIRWYETVVQRELQWPRCCRIFGDRDFIVLVNLMELHIWSFGEACYFRSTPQLDT